MQKDTTTPAIMKRSHRQQVVITIGIGDERRTWTAPGEYVATYANQQAFDKDVAELLATAKQQTGWIEP